MDREAQYFKRKQEILTDENICKENRKLFEKFFEEEEYKLKRKNQIKNLDDSCYKTLLLYICYFKNVNSWFKNKAWEKLTEEGIKKVYDMLEDGKAKGISGKVITYVSDYYNKVFKSLPFELAGKKSISEKVMKYYKSENKSNEDVRFFEEDTFKKIANATDTIKQRLLCYLCWDVGENIFTWLQIEKKNFVRQVNSETKEIEYIVNFPKDKIKRSRRARSEITNYHETAELLDAVLPTIEKDEDLLFNFGHRNALKFLNKVTKKVNAVCIPKGEKVTWKDFRSSMACHLLNIGYSTDEVKSRLGHTPSSKAIDKYANYLAIGKHKPKVKVQASEINKLNEEIERLKQKEKLTAIREETRKAEMDNLLREFADFKKGFGNIVKISEGLQSKSSELQKVMPVFKIE